MSILALWLMQAVMPAPSPSVDAAIADYRERTSIDRPCRRGSDDREVVVCALRKADRYRVPFVTSSAGAEAAAVRLDRLLPEDPAASPCGEGAFTVRCGMVGASVTAGFDGRVRTVQRPLAR